MNAEQQPVGDDHAGVREQLGAGLREPGASTRHMATQAGVLAHRRPCRGSRLGQQPAQIVQAPSGDGRIGAAGRSGQRLPMRPVGVRDHARAGVGQSAPLALAIGRQRPGVPLVERTAARQIGHRCAQPPSRRTERLHQPAAGSFSRRRNAQPVLSQLRAGQLAGTTGEPVGGQRGHHLPQCRHIPGHAPRRVQRAVRMDQLHQPGQQIPGQRARCCLGRPAGAAGTPRSGGCQAGRSRAARARFRWSAGQR
jgi:hypothetical protein